MSRSQFIAARNSRHRTAALALYRALVRTASRVPLPQNVRQSGSVGPIVHIVRKRFAKNKPYTSFRLIYAAMAAGYKFLTLLTKAHMPNSAEHAQILNHLHSLRNPSHTSRSTPRPFRKPQDLPKEPLLINVANPGEEPRYISRILPRPASSFQGDRKVPILCSTADGQPFLRIKKPQPRALSSMVGRKGKIFSSRIYNIVDVDEELAPAAALEDEWEKLMADLLHNESCRSEPLVDPDKPTSTYSWSAQLSRLWWEWKIERTWEDWVARGTALYHLVEEERALAEQEKGGNSSPHHVQSALRRQGKPRQKRVPDGPRPNVAQHPIPPLPLVEAVNAGLQGRMAGQEDITDPFTSVAWATLVKSEQGRLLRWMGKSDYGQSNDLDYPWKRPA